MSVQAVRTTRSETVWGRALDGILSSPKALIAGIVCILLLFVAVFGPWLAPQNPYDLAAIDFFDARLPPMSESMSGSVYVLGTDGQGRDMLSAMIYGLRTSLGVGLFAGFVALLVGTALGLTAAYFGGRIDTLIMRVVDLMLGLPTILVALMLLALLGQGVWKVILALVLVQWALFARAVRAAALVERGKEYVEAAVSLGLSKPRVLFGHMLPNCMPPIIVVGTLQVASAISAEATLSFLGIGLPITEPSLGLLIANGYQTLLSGQYWISVYPGLLLLLLVFSINIVGDRLREVLNPRFAGR
jgi:peptide/nickel transport system permease protein